MYFSMYLCAVLISRSSVVLLTLRASALTSAGERESAELAPVSSSAMIALERVGQSALAHTGSSSRCRTPAFEST